MAEDKKKLIPGTTIENKEEGEKNPLNRYRNTLPQEQDNSMKDVQKSWFLYEENPYKIGQSFKGGKIVETYVNGVVVEFSDKIKDNEGKEKEVKTQYEVSNVNYDTWERESVGQKDGYDAVGLKEPDKKTVGEYTKQAIDMRSESFLPTLDLNNTIMYRDYASFGQDPDAEVFRIYRKGKKGEKEFIGEYLVGDVEEYAPQGWEEVVQEDMDSDNPADMVIIPEPKDLGKNKWPKKSKQDKTTNDLKTKEDYSNVSFAEKLVEEWLKGNIPYVKEEIGSNLDLFIQCLEIMDKRDMDEEDKKDFMDAFKKEKLSIEEAMKIVSEEEDEYHSSGCDACDFGQGKTIHKLKEGGSSNSYLCKKCWEEVMQWRKAKNEELEEKNKYDILPCPGDK